jgi:hypothetical protein
MIRRGSPKRPTFRIKNSVGEIAWLYNPCITRKS